MQAQVLKGFRDYLPNEMIPRQHMIATIEQVFVRYGFSPLQTPTLEYSELLLGKYGEEGDKLLFRFLDNGDRDVAMRYDLTVPLARVLASHPDLILPFKRYHIGPVFRAEKPARGRFREFVQCDVDIIGVHDLAADAEVICAGISALQKLLHQHDTSLARQQRNGQPAFSVRLSNRQLLNGLCEKIAVTDNKKILHILRTLDKLEKQGKEVVDHLLATECALDSQQRQTIFNYLECSVSPQHWQALETFFADCAIGQKGIQELQRLVTLIAQHQLEEYITIDLSIARGLDYYTGTIYETSLNGLAGYGSIMSGGRYDQLLESFTGKSIAAVGISIGLDRLLNGLIELKILQERSSPSQVLVTVFSSDLRAFSTQLCTTLRQAHINTELYLGDDKIGKQIRYADRLKIPYVLIAGPDEAKNHQVKIKNLASGSEEVVEVDKLKDWAQRLSSI